MNKSFVPHIVELTDIITPKSCSSYIAELIKYVAYTKQQIPFPFERLKMFVLKRRERLKQHEFSRLSEEMKTSERVAIQMEKYYKKIEEAFEILDSTFKCIEMELLKSSGQPIEEVVLLFGATPISPKDIYRFKIPSLCHGHSDAQHLMKRQIANLFRGIIVSDEINNNLQRKVGLTNMFVMLKARKGKHYDLQWLIPKDHYKLSERAQQVCFSFESRSFKPCTCVLEENSYTMVSQTMAALRMNDCRTSPHEETNSDIEAEEHFVWFQTSRSLKGFKDSKLQGVSLTDLWYKYNYI